MTRIRVQRPLIIDNGWGSSRKLACFWRKVGPKLAHGACSSDNGGSAWQLLTQLLRQTQARDPRGKFFMGFDGEEIEPKGWSNVVRQRDECRITRFPTSIVTFEFRPLA